MYTIKLTFFRTNFLCRKSFVCLTLSHDVNTLDYFQISHCAHGIISCFRELKKFPLFICKYCCYFRSGKLNSVQQSSLHARGKTTENDYFMKNKLTTNIVHQTITRPLNMM